MHRLRALRPDLPGERDPAGQGQGGNKTGVRSSGRKDRRLFAEP
ncbi:MAG: hypothetical protein MZV70_67350 [Desulfobacterales bacterium]|nr:hypothetical protein [Desulfobacterales bacterium]